MPTKTIKTTVTLGVHAPDLDTLEVKDSNGVVLLPAAKGLKHVAPGEPVTLDADEADKILARFGGEEVAAPKPAPVKAAAPALAPKAADK